MIVTLGIVMSIRLFAGSALVGAVMALVLQGCSFVAARRGLNQMNAGNCKAAVDIMLPAAKAGYANSINNLGVIWERGCPEAGMAVNDEIAFNDFLIAGEKGVPIAFSNAGQLAESGFPGRSPDVSLAIRAYTMGARYGDPASINALNRLGQPIPGADLQKQALQAQHQKQLDIALLAVGIAAA